MCVGCGRIAPKPQLIRIVATVETPRDGKPVHTAVLDPGSRMPGRGAYLCRDPDGGRPLAECLERAIRRRAIARALRRAVTVPDRLVVESPGGLSGRAKAGARQAPPVRRRALNCGTDEPMSR